MVLGDRLGLLEGLPGDGWQEIEPADQSDLYPEPLGEPMSPPLGHPVLDYLEDGGDVGGIAGEIFGREPPQRDHRDTELGAPAEDVFRSLRSPPVSLPHIGEPRLAAVPPVAVLDQPEVPGGGAPEDRGEESSLVDPVQETRHILLLARGAVVVPSAVSAY